MRDNRNPIVSSLGDPFSGHETEDQPVEGRAAHPVELTVVGGGPGGLETARVAALRGHRVRVLEASDRFGGTVRAAARGVGWERLALMADWLESECRRLGVELVAGHRADADELALPGAHVVLAVGGRPGDRDYSVTRAATVRGPAEVLEDPDVLPEGTVVVWDPIGGPIGVSVAETLASLGRVVEIMTPDNIVGNELARSGDLAAANARLQQAGVVLRRRSLLRAVKKGVVVAEDRFTAERREHRAAAVVDAGHRLPDEELWQALSAHPDVHVDRVGDCVAPRTIHEAVLEGRRAALALG